MGNGLVVAMQSIVLVSFVVFVSVVVATVTVVLSWFATVAVVLLWYMKLQSKICYMLYVIYI